MGVFSGYCRTPVAQRDMREVANKIRRCTQHFLLLNTVLADRRFLLGDQMSLADIPFGTHLFRYFGLDIERPNLPHVARWYHTPQQQPVYRTHVMVPFGELHGRLAH